MSAIALHLKKLGYTIQGSDLHKTDITKNLELNDIKIFYKHNKKNILNADTVVISNAINEDNPELIQAKINGMEIYTRSQMLAKISSKYKNVIAISGAHGKTSTTEMTAEIFISSNKSPTVYIGGISNYFNSNLKIGKNKYFICEACEYKNAFLDLKPNLAVILNIEAEHLDFFKNFKNVQKSFEKFEKNCKNCLKVDKKNYIVYKDNFFLQAKNIYHLGNGKYGYDVILNNKYIGKILLNAIGKHNILNSLSATAIALLFKIPFSKIQKSLYEYKGVKRRYEIISQNPCLIISDYAHHPSEIKKIILSTKKYINGKIVVAFQPHTFTRTITLFQSFIESLNLANELHIIKTYSAREKYIEKGSAKNLAMHISGAYYHNTIKSCYNTIKKRLKKGDCLLILGAGNIDQLAEMFLLQI